MKTSDFDYHLPLDLIAQTPLEPRDSCRLLVLDRRAGSVEHRSFRDLPDYLDPGDVPATDESALGFLEFFTAVESEGKVGLGCSPEGVICAEWRFHDERAVGIWFLDTGRVRFSAIGKDGRFVDIKERNEVADRSEVTRALVEIQQELFAWRLG